MLCILHTGVQINCILTIQVFLMDNPATHVLIEQKGLDKKPRKQIKQSDGTLSNPFHQAKRYSAELPCSMRPRWTITCNFQEFLMYDMGKPIDELERIQLKGFQKVNQMLLLLASLGYIIVGRMLWTM